MVVCSRLASSTAARSYHEQVQVFASMGRSRNLNRRVFLQGTCQFAAGAAASLVLPLGARHSITASAATPETTSAVVDTADGKVRGAVVNGINVFKGLTYGASTSGPNRFMPPQKPESWAGVRDAFEFGPISPQRNPKLSAAVLAASIYAPGKPASIFAYPASVPDREDCLVLDIYTPGVTDRPSAAGDGLVTRRRLFARLGVGPGV